VPKGRFELPRPYGHYALNVARLPVPPLRRGIHLSRSEYSAVHLERQYEESVYFWCLNLMNLLSKLRRKSPGDKQLQVVQLLSRPGCHLCDDALHLLNREAPSIQVDVVDITQNVELESVYVFRIPVVIFEEEVLAEGIIGRHDVKSIKRHLANRRRKGKVAS
jgi:hypothetical protein